MVGWLYVRQSRGRRCFFKRIAKRSRRFRSEWHELCERQRDGRFGKRGIGSRGWHRGLVDWRRDRFDLRSFSARRQCGPRPSDLGRRRFGQRRRSPPRTDSERRLRKAPGAGRGHVRSVQYQRDGASPEICEHVHRSQLLCLFANRLRCDAAVHDGLSRPWLRRQRIASLAHAKCVGQKCHSRWS